MALLLFPALTVLNRWYMARIQRPVAEVQQGLGDLSSIAHESFDGALIVKTLGLARRESRRFHDTADRLRNSELEVGRLRAAFDPFLDALPNLGTLVLFLIGGWRIEAGAVTPGDLVQAALLFSILAFPMRVFGFFLQEMPRAVASIDRIDSVLVADDAESVERPPAVELPAGPLDLEVDDLHFTYDDEPVLDGVSFEVAAGETVALVGSTGSGKSTLMSSLVRLLRPQSGAVRVGGVDIDSVEAGELHDAVSLVFQQPFLFAESVWANVSLHRADDATVEAACEAALVSRFLPDLPDGSATVVGERGVTLSGGQRQRVALARALANQPRILLLDDATSAVDPVVEAEILDGLRDRSDTSLLIVAHRLSTIRLADRVVFLEGGRVEAAGAHDELLRRSDGYRALVNAYARAEAS